MIRNEAEYKEAVARLSAESDRLAEHRSRLLGAGLSEIETKRVMDPMLSFHFQLSEEVGSYERLQRREFDELENFRGVGRLLVALRIAVGMSQRDLAKLLKVHEFAGFSRRAKRISRHNA